MCPTIIEYVLFGQQFACIVILPFMYWILIWFYAFVCLVLWWCKRFQLLYFIYLLSSLAMFAWEAGVINTVGLFYSNVQVRASSMCSLVWSWLYIFPQWMPFGKVCLIACGSLGISVNKYVKLVCVKMWLCSAYPSFIFNIYISLLSSHVSLSCLYFYCYPCLATWLCMCKSAKVNAV